MSVPVKNTVAISAGLACADLTWSYPVSKYGRVPGTVPWVAVKVSGCLHMVAGRELAGDSFCEGTSTIHEDLPRDLITSHRSRLLTPSHWGQGFNI